VEEFWLEDGIATAAKKKIVMSREDLNIRRSIKDANGKLLTGADCVRKFSVHFASSTVSPGQ
jgi:hypothetical protein